MNELFEILKILLPSLVIFLLVYFLVSKYFKAENQKRHLQTVVKNQEIITPLRLQAYERIILFLERISPENIVVRVDKTGNTSKQLHTDLINTIRAEFEHNLTQQLYISINSWESVKHAKAHIIHLINNAFEKVKPETPSINLSREILETAMNQPKLYTAEAINKIKTEMNSLLE